MSVLSRRRAAVVVAVALAVVVTVMAVVIGSDDSSTVRSASTTTTSTSRPTSTLPVDPEAPETAPVTSAPVTTTGPPVTPNGRFTIVGGDIVGPDGKVFVPMGANMAVRQGGYEEGYAFNWNGTGTGHVDDVLAWGWNTVRATLVCLPTGSPSTDELNAGIDDFIQEYTAKHVVVIVECHDITLKNYGVSSPQVQGLYAFWDRLAQKWHDNPYVWFNTFNEPIGDATPAAVTDWLALQRDALKRLRAVAPTSVFVADIPGGGQAVDAFAAKDSIRQLSAGQCNVLYSWHAYGALGNHGVFGKFADYDNEQASRANHEAALKYLRDNRIPLVVGEVGDPLTLNEGTAGQPIWNRIGGRAVIQLAPKYGIGMLWWHATGDSGVFLTYSLMADRHAPPWAAATTGEGLSDTGRLFWDASKQQPAPQPFTGDLSTSNCG